MPLNLILNIMEEEQDVVDIENTTEEADLNTAEELSESSEQSEESIDWKAEAEKQKAIAESQKIRAEKAERATKPLVKTEAKAEVNTGLSSKDTIALINAKVHEDDVEDVIEYAKFKKISVSEALKSSIIRSSLAEKQEFRNTANASNTGKTRAGSAKVSGDNLLDKAKKTGEVPDSDEALDALLTTRYSKKK